jgi:ABC-type nitrate/sulfonate/bicarbonate transport system substrate-binding protein
MTGGQTDLMWATQTTSENGGSTAVNSRLVSLQGNELPVVLATNEELNAHQNKLQTVAKASDDQCLWLNAQD